MTSTSLCCELSERAGEPIAATASFARAWLVVEVPGTWPRDVSEGAGLPSASSEAVQRWLARTPDSRLLYVRRPGRPRAAGLLAFVVRAGEGQGGGEREVRRFELPDLEALGSIDLDAEGAPTTDPLVLVCGHGTRDRCCALRGTAVYGALASELDPDALWISSHQGGHRFAANVLVLPSAIQLGRVGIDEAASLVTEVLAGGVPLGRYRGRGSYPPEAQAADIALRDALGFQRADDLVFEGVRGEHLLFRDRAGREHAAVVDGQPGPVVPASCGAEPEAQRVLSALLL